MKTSIIHTKNLYLINMYRKPDIQILQAVPDSWFIAKGCGQSDFGHEGGSVHEAMIDAGIGHCNLMPLSYSIPVKSAEIRRPELPEGILLPSVSIFSHGLQGETHTAAIAFGKVLNAGSLKPDAIILCKNIYTEQERFARESILRQLNYSFNRRYSDEEYSLVNVRLILQEIQISQPYGTAMVAVCFCPNIL